MWRRVAVSSGTLAGVPFAVSTIYAADDKPKDKADQPSVKKCKAKDLPLYGEPSCTQIEMVAPEVSPIETNIAIVRKAVWGFMDSFTSTTNWCSDKYDVSKAHSSELVTYLQEDSGALPRAAIITVSGLGGVVAGYKGGFFRKFLFGSAGMLSAGAICYPPQAMDIGRAGWQRVYNEAKQMWETKSKGDVTEPPAISKKIEEEVSKNLDKMKDAEPSTKDEKNDKKQLDTQKDSKPKDAKGDHGMSKKEDKDMYTTRGK